MEARDLAFAMVVKNEAPLLGRLLDRVKTLVSEFVIVDTGSSDGTQTIALQYTPSLLYWPLTGDFGAARNTGLSQTHRPWTLVIDADEWPTDELLEWIRSFTPPDHIDGVFLPRHNLLDGKPLVGGLEWENHMRLFRQSYRYESGLHESVVVPEERSMVAPRKSHLVHDKPSIRQTEQNALYTRIGTDRRIYLNLGCGGKTIRNWINVDAQALPGVDKVHDMHEPLPYPDQYATRVWASHVLEHFNPRVASGVLSDWMRVLKVGGIIELAFPDLAAILERYHEGNLQYVDLISALYGLGTDTYNTHRNAFDWPWIAGQLGWWGAEQIERIPESWQNLVVRAVKVRHVESIL